MNVHGAGKPSAMQAKFELGEKDRGRFGPRRPVASVTHVRA